MDALPDFAFARTHHDYPSYTDFWRLVELSGYPIVRLEEIDLEAERVYIFTPFNGELERFRGVKRNCRLVWWMLERFDVDIDVTMADRVSRGLEIADTCWVSDRWVSTLDLRLRFVPFGSHPALRPDTPLPREAPTYDFAHVSYAWGRRADLYSRLRNLGLREAPATWGEARHEALDRTRVLVNAQQYPGPVTAPLRFALAAAYVLPVVSETIIDPAPLEWSDLLVVPFDAVPDAVYDICRRDKDFDAVRLSDRLLKEWPFSRGVEEALCAL